MSTLEVESDMPILISGSIPSIICFVVKPNLNNINDIIYMSISINNGYVLIMVIKSSISNTPPVNVSVPGSNIAVSDGSRTSCNKSGANEKNGLPAPNLECTAQLNFNFFCKFINCILY